MATKKTSTKEVQLRKPQLRILAALAKSKEPLDRKTIAAKSKTDICWIGNYVGSGNVKVRAKLDRDFPSLVTLNYAKVSDEGLYQITPTGRKALQKGGE